MSLAADDRLNVAELREAQRRVMRRLDRVRRLLRLHLAVEGLFWIVLTVGGLALSSYLLDRWLRFDPATRWILLALAAAAIVYVAFRRLVRPLLVPLADLDLAELLDRRSPGVGQQIASVLQLPDLLDSEDHASPSMVRSAVLECAQALDRRDLSGTLNVARRHKLLAAIGLILLLAAIAVWLWPTTARLWARRWLAGSSVRWPQHTYLQVRGVGEDGVLLVPRGETTVLAIDANPRFSEHDAGRWQLGGRGPSLIVESSDAPTSVPPEQVSVSYTLADGTPRRGNAEKFDAAGFRYELAPLAEPADLHVAGGDDWLGPITIEPVDRPGVGKLTIAAVLPGSSGDKPEQVEVGESTSQLLYLPQTKLTLTLTANQPLARAELLNAGAPLAGWTRTGERTYTVAWTMDEALALEFRLTGQRGQLVSKPYFLAIGVLKDREPRVTIRTSGVGRRVTPVARVPLFVRANDDFGLASLVLDWELTAQAEGDPKVEAKQLPLADLKSQPDAEGPQTQFEFTQELALAEHKLSPGNALKLRGTATDQCSLGKQTGSSRWIALQIVSAEELFYDILMRQREQRAKFAAALESAKTQAKTLADLSQPEDAFGLGRAQQVINRQVWQVTGALAATLEEMTLNDLGNPAARENLQSTVITPLGKLHDDLLAKLRASVDGVAPGGAIDPRKREEAQALADQSVEVMQSILAQMSLWESFVDVINQLKRINDLQKGVLKATEEIDKDRTEQLFD